MAVASARTSAISTGDFIRDLSGAAVKSNKTGAGNINYVLSGGEKGWAAASKRISSGLNVSYSNGKSGAGMIVKGTTRDGASVEIRGFSSGKGVDSYTIKVSELGSRIKHMYRWEKPK